MLFLIWVKQTFKYKDLCFDAVCLWNIYVLVSVPVTQALNFIKGLIACITSQSGETIDSVRWGIPEGDCVHMFAAQSENLWGVHVCITIPEEMFVIAPSLYSWKRNVPWHCSS